MSMHFRDLADRAKADGVISPDELRALRQTGWADGKVSPEEVDALFAVNDVLAATSPEWCDFFVEAVSEWVLNSTPPKGYVEDTVADWLIQRVDHDGKLETVSELELLIDIFERSQNTPQQLRDYAVKQIETAVLTGSGPTRSGGALDTGGINATEAGLLRRILFASGGDRPAAISRNEAELLFRLKDATLGQNNAPEWKMMFVQGVANYIQGYQTHVQLDRGRAGQLETFIANNGINVGGFVGKMINVLTTNPLKGFRDLAAERAEAEARTARDRFAEADVEAQVTSGEQTWLDGKNQADNRIDELEQALLDFLAEGLPDQAGSATS